MLYGEKKKKKKNNNNNNSEYNKLRFPLVLYGTAVFIILFFLKYKTYVLTRFFLFLLF